MLLVPCPNCGPRNASEMHYVGEATPRPDPDAATPAEWRAYLYLRANTAGPLRETWYCRSGCRRYFVLERNTVTNSFSEADDSGSPLPGAKTGNVP